MRQWGDQVVQADCWRVGDSSGTHLGVCVLPLLGAKSFYLEDKRL